MSAARSREQPSSLPMPSFEERVLDLREDGHDLDLFLRFPFFVDVLEWLAGTRPFSNIRHAYGAVEFERDILPACLRRLRQERLISSQAGRHRPLHRNIVLRGVSEDPLRTCEHIASQTDLFLQRAFGARRAARFELTRTRASAQRVAEWEDRLVELFDEVQRSHDPYGVPFSAHLMTLQGA